MLLLVSTLLGVLLFSNGAGLAPDAIGTVQTSGPVFLNGIGIYRYAVVFDGDRLETGPGGTASLVMSPKDRLLVGERSAILLKSSREGVFADVEQGRLQVNSSHQRLRQVRLGNEGVSISSTPGLPRNYLVSRLEGASYVLARQGSLTVRDEWYGGTTEVPEGMVGGIRSEPGDPGHPQTTQQPTPASSTGSHRAGIITALIPADYIWRGGTKTPAAKDAVVNWLDEVESAGSGRARIVLGDGSILSLGSKSRLRIIQHDAQSQSTNLELSYGRVRAQVTKLGNPNSNFEIRTSTAVCGVLGTDFFVETDGKKTRLVVFEGRVTFTPIVKGVVAGATAAVTVLAGQMSTATAGAAVAPASSGVASTTAATSTTISSQAASATTAVAAQAASRLAIIVASAAPAAATVAIVAVATTNNPPPSPSQP